MTSTRSFRLEMLQVARLAPKVLGDSAALVAEFVKGQCTPEGGFADRGGRPDLYYSVFGLEALLALRVEPDRVAGAAYVQGFGDGEGLDFVHLCSLARCAANLGRDVLSADTRERLAARVEAFRTPDGGYHGSPGRDAGSAYGALLAWGAYSDLSLKVPGEERLLESLLTLRLQDGSFANEPDMPQGTTPTTAAAVVLCRHMGAGLPGETGAWLLQQAHASGGFLALPGAPLPDLLSTATALHALESLEMNYDALRETCLDYVDSLWNARGGFHGHWADDDLDVEYTFYGLLALGHLGR
ncbi:MAG: prenyltransferase/squalene oxidase repeat-containing protein [Verrucomicrobium sp.]